MTEYTVRVPIVGYVEAYVTADDEESAIEQASVIEFGDPNAQFFFEAVKHIVEGNIFYGSLNNIEIEIEDDEDD